MANKFARYVWGAVVGLSEPSITAVCSYTLVDRRAVTSDSGVMAWEHRGMYQDGSESNWLSESEVTNGFTPLQHDIFRAPMNFYAPRRSDPPRERVRKQHGPHSRRGAFRLFSTGTPIVKHFRDRELQGQIFSTGTTGESISKTTIGRSYLGGR